VHYFAWFEGFSGEEAAAGAFDVGFADLDVHFHFFFPFLLVALGKMIWGRRPRS
jgi:hypothetical protein